MDDLLQEYYKLTRNLNPNFPIEANSGKMIELISLSKRVEKENNKVAK